MLILYWFKLFIYNIFFFNCRGKMNIIENQHAEICEKIEYKLCFRYSLVTTVE